MFTFPLGEGILTIGSMLLKGQLHEDVIWTAALASNLVVLNLWVTTPQGWHARYSTYEIFIL